MIKKILIACFMCLILVGCSSENKSSSNIEAVYDGLAPSVNYDFAYGNLVPESNELEKKIIVSGSMRLETKDLDKTLADISDNILDCEGYIQSSDSSKNYKGNRYFYAVVRVPSDKYNAFINSLKDTGNVINYTYSTEDITDSYYDSQTRLNTLEAEYSKVLEFYDKAESIQELISVEDRLTDIQYEIDAIKLRLKNYDLLTNYSTLDLSVTETEILTNTEENFSAKVNNAFVEGLQNLKLNVQNFIVFAAYNIWLIVAILTVAIFMFFFIRNKRKKKNCQNKIKD